MTYDKLKELIKIAKAPDHGDMQYQVRGDGEIMIHRYHADLDVRTSHMLIADLEPSREIPNGLFPIQALGHGYVVTDREMAIAIRMEIIDIIGH